MTRSAKFIFNAFIKLTSMTCPYGYEDQLVKEMTACGLFPEGLSRDEHGNYFIQIGESRTIFASHLDTVSKSRTKVTHVFEGDYIKTDGTTTLGADDKAGVAVMLWMMKNGVPGMYYFFMGEEVGCIGSGNAARSVAKFEGVYDRIISFDRRGTGSVITHQSWARCCSEAFGDALAAELNKSGLSYVKDDGGVYTDSAEFIDIISECTNISVGYYKEHTFDERQDIAHLQLLADACCEVDWESLPTKREAGVAEYKGSSSKPSSYSSSGWSTHDGWGNSSRGKGKKKKKSGRGSMGYHDDWYDERWGDYPGWDDYEEQDDTFSEWEKMEKSEPVKGKKYYDSGSGLVQVDAKSKYEWVMEKFVGSKLTHAELGVVAEQYLDMNDPEDRSFRDFLSEYISEQSL